MTALIRSLHLSVLIMAILTSAIVTVIYHRSANAQEEFLQVTVYADKVTYTPEDGTVNINGCIHSATSSLSGKWVTINIIAPSGQLIASHDVIIDDTCNFKHSIDFEGVEAEFGNYLVRASYGGQTGETAFRFSNESNAKNEGECSIDYCTYYFELYAKIYPIEYQVTSGRVVAMFVDFPAHALMVVTNSTSDGLMTIVLPREIIDSKQENGSADKEYFVSINDFAQGSGSGEINFRESRLTFEDKESRILQIDYPAGNIQIQIAGTYLVPEFAVPIFSIAMMIVVITAIMIAKGKPKIK